MSGGRFNPSMAGDVLSLPTVVGLIIKRRQPMFFPTSAAVRGKEFVDNRVDVANTYSAGRPMRTAFARALFVLEGAYSVTHQAEGMREVTHERWGGLVGSFSCISNASLG